MRIIGSASLSDFDARDRASLINSERSPEPPTVPVGRPLFDLPHPRCVALNSYRRAMWQSRTRASVSLQRAEQLVDHGRRRAIINRESARQRFQSSMWQSIERRDSGVRESVVTCTEGARP